MVNRKCDFCDNSYKRAPTIGYFMLTPALKASLSLKEGAGFNTICGDHFAETAILENGRLRPDATPVFFPRLSTA